MRQRLFVHCGALSRPRNALHEKTEKSLYTAMYETKPTKKQTDRWTDRQTDRQKMVTRRAKIPVNVSRGCHTSRCVHTCNKFQCTVQHDASRCFTCARDNWRHLDMILR